MSRGRGGRRKRPRAVSQRSPPRSAPPSPPAPSNEAWRPQRVFGALAFYAAVVGSVLLFAWWSASGADLKPALWLTSAFGAFMGLPLLGYLYEQLSAARRSRRSVPAPKVEPALDAPAVASPPVAVRVRPADFDATVAMLERRGRDADAWHADLRALNSAGGYRGPGIRIETLEAIADDDDAPRDAREAASLMLRART